MQIRTSGWDHVPLNAPPEWHPKTDVTLTKRTRESERGSVYGIGLEADDEKRASLFPPFSNCCSFDYARRATTTPLLQHHTIYATEDFGGRDVRRVSSDQHSSSSGKHGRDGTTHSAHHHLLSRSLALSHLRRQPPSPFPPRGRPTRSQRRTEREKEEIKGAEE